MQLSELIANINSKNYNLKKVKVKSIEFDSKKIKPGSVFIAIKGEKFDGHNFIDDVKKNGAVAIITQKKVETELPQIVVNDTRSIMGELSKRFYGEFEDICKIGVTGTNGKTTTAFLIHSILTAAGRNPGLIGTIYYLGKAKIKAERTTPESLDIFKLLDRFRTDGAKAVVMEVSSHALSLKRVDDIKFLATVFTNFGQDHLDFHKSVDDYRKSKLHIFSLLDVDGIAVFNVDDSTSPTIKKMHIKKTVTYGIKNHGDIWGQVIDDSINGIKVEVLHNNKKYRIDSKLIGGFNAYNICAAFATGIAMGIDVETIVRGIEELKIIKGRMERVVDNIFVDFAHTPSAIENTLMSLKRYTSGKVIIVFGCGGDRDREKRPKMGAIASSLADFVIITSDNPRSESPKKIIEAIKRGIGSNNYTIIEDRKQAISYAIAAKKSNDIVLITGKGHEEYQIIGDKINQFDDAKVARECFVNL